MLAHARALHLAGRLTEAERAYRHALRDRSRDPAIYNDLGALLAALDRHAEAVTVFSVACNLDPRFATAFSNLGASLMRERRMNEAVGSLRVALQLDPAMAEAHANLGNALLELLHPADAIPPLERALALDPALAQAHYARGQAKLLLGELEAAKDSFAAAVALRPGNGPFYDGLTAVRLLASDDPNFVAMEALARASAGNRDPGQIGLHFGLFRTYEHQGRHPEAFAHLVKGNALRRARIPYDEAAALGAMQRIGAAFDAAALRRVPERGTLPDTPIFIVGMPRSGSTLVEQIICSHPLVFGAGEVGLLADEAARVAESDPAGLAGADRAVLEDFANAYRARLRALAPGAERITDKRLSNFMQLGLIRLALPDARVIHTVRDPADTCLSCFGQTFNRELGYANDLAELGRYYRGYAGMMAHWGRVIEAGFVLEVHYEMLVNDFEAQVRRILDFCGLPWDAACLAFHETRRPVLTASAAQVRRPLYQGAVGRAGRYGALLRPLYDALGVTAAA